MSSIEIQNSSAQINWLGSHKGHWALVDLNLTQGSQDPEKTIVQN